MLKKQVCPTGKLVSSSFLSILNLKLVNPPCGALKLPVIKNKNCVIDLLSIYPSLFPFNHLYKIIK